MKIDHNLKEGEIIKAVLGKVDGYWWVLQPHIHYVLDATQIEILTNPHIYEEITINKMVDHSRNLRY